MPRPAHQCRPARRRPADRRKRSAEASRRRGSAPPEAPSAPRHARAAALRPGRRGSARGARFERNASGRLGHNVLVTGVRIAYLAAYGALSALGEALVARNALIWLRG